MKNWRHAYLLDVQARQEAARRRVEALQARLQQDQARWQLRLAQERLQLTLASVAPPPTPVPLIVKDAPAFQLRRFMRIEIVFDDEQGKTAIVTQRPSWIGRLFRRRPRSARVYTDTDIMWRYVADDSLVPETLRQRLIEERRWRIELNEGMPAARLLKDKP